MKNRLKKVSCKYSDGTIHAWFYEDVFGRKSGPTFDSCSLGGWRGQYFNERSIGVFKGISKNKLMWVDTNKGGNFNGAKFVFNYEKNISKNNI